MKTARELADDFFDGPGRKQDLIGLIEADRREVRAAALREAVETMASANDGTRNPFVALMLLANEAERGE